MVIGSELSGLVLGALSVAVLLLVEAAPPRSSSRHW